VVVSQDITTNKVFQKKTVVKTISIESTHLCARENLFIPINSNYISFTIANVKRDYGELVTTASLKTLR
jgi:hypothetical protein